MSFLNRVLEPPRFGYERNGKFYAPSLRELFSEFFYRFDLKRDRRNWLAVFGWWSSFILIIPFFVYLFNYLSWGTFAWGFFYSMVIMGTHGTIWYHRYGTHRAYAFADNWAGRIARFVTRNLVIRIIPEETYVVSHHVHHAFSEEPGDPYNVNGGFWYCFLADVTTQPIVKDLTPEEYQRLTHMLAHTKGKVNSYEQYQKWGSLCHPAREFLHFGLNWAFWYGVFYWIGGHPVATASFGGAFTWAFGVRTFNFEGHGAGKDKHRDGIDFNRADLSINQKWPGLITGEWHNNHHLYPNGARAGFLSMQWDYAWYYIKALSWVGLVSHYRDFTADFFKNHYDPWVAKQRAFRAKAETPEVTVPAAP